MTTASTRKARAPLREGKVADYLHEKAKFHGGEHRRVEWIGRSNAPDALILLPGEHFYVECKRPTTDASEGQEREHERMRAAGMRVYVARTYAEVDALPWPKT